MTGGESSARLQLRSLVTGARARLRDDEPACDFGAELASTVAYLGSDTALASLRRDPYWPKWDSPWWMVLLLHELGEARQVPASILPTLLDIVRHHFLDFFPLTLDEIPEGADPYRHVMCHCALGSLYRMARGSGLDIEQHVPWARRWFVRHQLPDGGLNCDEGAYTRAQPRSSFLSTLPPLEALLLCMDRPLEADEEAFLDGGARYLLKRHLFRSLSQGGRPADETWLLPAFPRFYGYDVLRGLAFVTAWAHGRRRTLSAADVLEVVQAMAERVSTDGLLSVGRDVTVPQQTLTPGPDGLWEKEMMSARSFPLLDAARSEAVASIMLTRQWTQALEALHSLDVTDQIL